MPPALHTTKIHVLYFSQIPIFGGGEKYLADLLNHLPDYLFRLTLLCTYLETMTELRKRVTAKVDWIYLPEDPSPSIWKTIWPLSRKFAALNPDILHCNGIDAYGGSYAIMAGKIARIPVVVGTFHMSKSYEPYTLQQNIFRSFVDHSLDSAIAVSQSARENVLVNRKLSPEKVMVINNGVDISDQAGCFDRAGGNYLRIGVVARLVPGKAIDILLQSAQKLLKTYQGIRFFIAGDGPERDQLTSLADQLGVKTAVHFIGWQENIRDFLTEIDIYVSSSQSEGLPIATIEAMASGLPVVCTDVGGVSEVVVHGKTGFLVPANDPSALAQSIQILLDNPELRREMGQAGRKRVELYFTVEKMVLRTQQYYLDLLSRKHRKTDEH